ncbi:MAG: toprim domain-containing protein, partial [Deltaproteobacteria bacterium]|nr:toprim domain-containing protein [Deltaproteobacteria bacterium]
MQEIEARAKVEKEQSQKAAAIEARKVWDQAQPATENHPYLKRKQVKPYGTRIDDKGNLLVPIHNETDDLISIQTIFPVKPATGSDKRFFPDAKTGGGYFFLEAGKTVKVLDKIGVGEGFATCASIVESTGYPVYTAFNANNLKAVAQIARRKHPDSEIIICCDDDRFKPENAGRTKGQEAARSIDRAKI